MTLNAYLDDLQRLPRSSKAEVQALALEIAQVKAQLKEASVRAAKKPEVINSLQSALVQWVNSGQWPVASDQITTHKSPATAHKSPATACSSRDLPDDGPDPIDHLPAKSSQLKTHLLTLAGRLALTALFLAVHIARRYRGRHVEYEDLIQEGNIGLIRAALAYDHTAGVPYGTYAAWWVRAAIERALVQQRRYMRWPAHIHQRMRQYYRAALALGGELGREPTAEEISAKSGLRLDQIDMLRQIMGQHWLSLNDDQDDQHRPVPETIADDTSPSAQEFLEQAALSLGVQAAVATLPKIERQVVALRFGLGPYAEHTLAQVAARMQLPLDRVSPIEHRALRRLAQGPAAAVLKALL